MALMTLGVLPLVALGFLGRLQRQFCPPDTLVCGHLNGGGVPVGAVGLAVGFLALGFGASRVMTPRSGAGWRAWLAIALGVLLVAVAGPVGALDLGNFYCATPDGIELRRTLQASTRYRWSDVRSVSPECRQGKLLDVFVTLTFTDGVKIDIGGDSWPDTQRNYPQISRLLAGADFDPGDMADCPPDVLALFGQPPR